MTLSPAPGAGARAPEAASWRLPRRLAYVVSHSQPWSSDGYAVRSQEIAKALTEAGHEVIIFTRPGLPLELEGKAGLIGRKASAGDEIPLDHKIDGIRHIHLPSPPLPGASRIERVRAHAAQLTEAFRVFRPAAVLGASNWETAEPARRAAGRTGAAFFYEQRGFWELAPGTDPAQAEEARARELEIALGARGVFTLNAAMKAELVTRGVPEGRIQLMPNGLSYRQRRQKRLRRADIGCTSRYLLAYIGSLNAYEGVGDLIALVARLRAGEGGLAPLDVDALIIGSDAPKGLIGEATTAPATLKAEAEALGIGAHVHFVPQVPADEVASWYPICDALVLPRRLTPVTALVPPVKPYGAFAQGLPVFMSDLPPMAEIAAEIHGSLFPPGDLAELARMVHHALLRGHKAASAAQNMTLEWRQRVRPLSVLLDLVAQSETARNLALLGAPGAQAAASARQDGAGQSGEHSGLFDLTSLPSVGLRLGLGGSLVTLGPPQDAGAAPAPADAPADAPPRAAVGAAVGRGAIPARRNTLLDLVATAEPGRLVIDWAGLQAAPDRGDWEGLWSIHDMRLNRLVMDALRIARQRGWRVIVRGPVNRAEAPLFRTIAAVVEETLPAELSSGPAPAGPADQMSEGPAAAPAPPAATPEHPA